MSHFIKLDGPVECFTGDDYWALRGKFVTVLTKHHAMKAYAREGSEWSAPRASHNTPVK